MHVLLSRHNQVRTVHSTLHPYFCRHDLRTELKNPPNPRNPRQKPLLVETDFEGSIEEAVEVGDLVDDFGGGFAEAVAGFGVVAEQ